MSYPTVPAYIQHVKGWEVRLREHPALDWMFDYEEAFDRGTMKGDPYHKWHTDDFSHTKPTGEVAADGAASWAAILETYAPFSAHYHEPFFVALWDTPTGYALFGQAKVFARLPTPAPEGGEPTKTDLDGRKWDVELRGAFHFEFVRDPEGPKGLKMRSESIFADELPLVGEMAKRGMVTTEQVMAMASK